VNSVLAPTVQGKQQPPCQCGHALLHHPGYRERYAEALKENPGTAHAISI